MKLSVMQENLARGLAVVSRAVSNRSTLPVLANVLLRTEDGGLRLTTTNLEIGLVYWVPGKVETDGATTVPARLLTDLVSSLPGGERIELAQAVLSNVLYNPKKRQITPERIAKAVSEYYGVGLDALKGQKRDKAIVVPRQIAMFLMREETDVSLLRIGAELGGRDHSTVLHACDKITRESAGNDELRREIAAVRELIYAD